MLVEIHGISQVNLSVELNTVPRVGETLTILYGADAEVKGTVASVHHHINQHSDEHKIMISIRQSFDPE